MEWCKKTDGELVAAFASSGAQAAFAELVRRHAAMVFRTCRRVTANHQDAEDATQSVFATLVLRSAELTSYPSLGGWLYSAAWRVSRRYRRAQLARRRHEHRAQPVIPNDGNGGGADDADLTAEVYRAIEMLPPDYRDAVVLHHLEGFTVQQLADVTGCSIGTAASRLSRARAMMRERLNGRGVVMADAVMTAWVVRDFFLEPVSESTVLGAATAGAAAMIQGGIAPLPGGAAEATGATAARTAVDTGMTLYAGLSATKWAAVIFVSAGLAGGAAAGTGTVLDRNERARWRESAWDSETRTNTAAAHEIFAPFGDGSGSNSGSAVPEPSCLGLLALGGLFVQRHRRRPPTD